MKHTFTSAAVVCLAVFMLAGCTEKNNMMMHGQQMGNASMGKHAKGMNSSMMMPGNMMPGNMGKNMTNTRNNMKSGMMNSLGGNMMQNQMGK